jgi:hypothetical protein
MWSNHEPTTEDTEAGNTKTWAEKEYRNSLVDFGQHMDRPATQAEHADVLGGAKFLPSGADHRAQHLDASRAVETFQGDEVPVGPAEPASAFMLEKGDDLPHRSAADPLALLPDAPIHLPLYHDFVGGAKSPRGTSPTRWA